MMFQAIVIIIEGAILAFCIWAFVKAVTEVHNASKWSKKVVPQAGIRVEGEKLYIDRQHEKISTQFSIIPHKSKSYDYVPEELHVGAVTVGGITTGGTYKTGGYIHEKSYNSGKYDLCYANYGHNEPQVVVKEIVLSTQLAEKARNSPISQYLKGNSIIVVNEVEPSAINGMMMYMGKTTSALTLMEQEKSEGYPTKEKCEAILKWLSGSSAPQPYAETYTAPAEVQVPVAVSNNKSEKPTKRNTKRKKPVQEPSQAEIEANDIFSAFKRCLIMAPSRRKNLTDTKSNCWK